jgi:hypothetical protein
MSPEDHADEKILETITADAARAFPPPASLKKEVRAQVLSALAQQATGEATHSMAARTGLWRRALRPRWIGVAAAAACIVVALVGWWHFSSSPNGGPVLVQSAYAQLVEAIEQSKQAEWVRMVAVVPGSRDQIEAWQSFKPTRIGHKDPGGKCSYLEEETGKRFEYDPSTGTVKILDSFPSEWEAESMMDAVEKTLQGVRDSGGKVVSNNETVGGKVCVVYSVRSAEDKETYRLAVDTTQRRVVRFWSFSNGQAVAGDFDYPASGPESIYDLGVPREAKVVDDRKLDQQTWQLVRNSARVGAAFEKSFYAATYTYEVRLSDDGTSAEGQTLRFFHVKNGRLRRDQYYLAQYRSAEFGLQWGETLAGMEAWSKDKQPQQVDLPLGDKTIEYLLPYSSRNSEVTKSIGSGHIGTGIGSWAYSWMGKSLPAIDGPNGRLLGTRGVGSSQVFRGKESATVWQQTTIYVNPARDYLAEREELWTASGDEPWVPESDRAALKALQAAADPTHVAPPRKRTTTILEYAQTSAGHWYARKKLTETEDLNGKVTKFITITHLDTTRAIPDDVFDWRKFEAQLGRPLKMQ